MITVRVPARFHLLGICVIQSSKFRSAVAVSLGLVLTLFAAACEDKPTEPSHFAPFSQSDLVAGTGAEAAVGNLLSVQYTGWLFNEREPEQKGPQFDSSRGGTVPFSFTLGAGEVIAGWDRGLVGMRAGGIRRLIIPSSLAYGGSRAGKIPPNATLVFEVELVELTQ